MIIFRYHITDRFIGSAKDDKIFRIVITDDKKDNVTTWFRDKKYKHTLAPKDIKHIIKIIKAAPGLFDIPKELEPNESLGGSTISASLSATASARIVFMGKIFWITVAGHAKMPRSHYARRAKLKKKS